MASVSIRAIRGRIFACRMAIPHSTFSTSLPQIYTFFPTAPSPASKYAILSASLQPSNNQSFIIRRPTSHLPHTAFPTTKRHLSTFDSCPFEAPSLTFRISIPKPSQPERCPTPHSAHLFAYAKRQKLAPIGLPRPLFRPKIRHKIFTKNL